jgi:hypothetical protein
MTAFPQAEVPLRQDPLLQPFQIKNLVLKNRIMSTSHAAGLEVDGFPQERYQLYHEEKAKGGIALTMFGGSSNVAPLEWQTLRTIRNKGPLDPSNAVASLPGRALRQIGELLLLDCPRHR